MITIIDVDINEWCKSYRKTSKSKSQTSIYDADPNVTGMQIPKGQSKMYNSEKLAP